MEIKFLVAASLSTMPAIALQDPDMSDRCKPMGIMMGVHKAEPFKPEEPPKPSMLPKAQIETTGPAVLIPNCKDEYIKRRKKGDHPLA